MKKNDILIAYWIGSNDVDIVEVTNKCVRRPNKIESKNFFRIVANRWIQHINNPAFPFATIKLDGRRTDFVPATQAEIDKYIPAIINYQLKTM